MGKLNALNRGCVNCVVAKNTICDPSRWLPRILQETTTAPVYRFEACRDGVFVKNLISFEWASLSTWLNIGPNMQPESVGIYCLDPELDADAGIPASSPAAAAGIITPWTEGDFGGSCYRDPPSVGAFATSLRLIGSEGAAAPVCPHNRASRCGTLGRLGPGGRGRVELRLRGP
jgi:hypothetical protein